MPGVKIQVDVAPLSGLLQRIEGIPLALSDVLETVGNELVQTIPEQLKNVVETTPSALVPNKGNRVWTGYMRDTAGAQVERHSWNYTKISYGWINGLNGFNDGKGFYVADQEFGNTGRHIWGMDALAKVQATQLKQDDIGDRVRKALSEWLK